MKILFILSSSLPFSTNGVAVYTYNLARWFIAHGCHVTLFSPVDNRDEQPYVCHEIEYEGIRVVTVNYRPDMEPIKLFFDFHLLYRNYRIDSIVTQLIKKLRPDIVHIQHVVYLSTSLIQKIKKMNIPVVVTLNDYWFLCGNMSLMFKKSQPHYPSSCGYECLLYLVEQFQPEEERTMRYLLRRSLAFYIQMRRRMFSRLVHQKRYFALLQLSLTDIILAPSRFLRDIYINAGIDSKKIMYSDYGFPTPFCKTPKVNRKDRRTTFAYLGRIVPEKGIHVLIEAFNEVQGGAALYIFGTAAKSFEGYEKKLRLLAKNNDYVFFKGLIPSESIPEVLREVDYVVVPSLWWENSPLVIHEAFFSRIPVITANVGGMSELVHDGENGLLFKCGDVADLRKVLQRAINEPSLSHKLISGIAAVKSIEENAQELLGIYHELRNHT
jgi:glycosyltransferase involved in cell wall biosynthesis